MSPDRFRYDAVVVGARAAGAATAMLLARAGLRVLLVDRSHYGADTLSTHALMRAGVIQLRRWGLLDRIVDAGTPAVRRTTFRYADEDIVVPIKPSFGIDAVYAPRRTVLDPVLVDAAVDAGAEVRYGTTVLGVERDSGGRVSGVVCRDDRGHRSTIDARFVVGADGMRSAVADYVDAPIERMGTGAMAVVYGYWSGVEADGYEWVFRSDACAGVIPTNDGLVCVFASGAPARIGRGGRRVLESVLEQASAGTAARVRAGVAPPGVRSFAGQAGFMRRAWGPGWALVGDASHWKDPISVHGLTDALRDGELLARAIVAARSRQMPEAEAMATYQAERDRLSRSLFDVVDVIAGQRWTDREIGPLLLQLSAAMADEVEAVTDFDKLGALDALDVA